MVIDNELVQFSIYKIDIEKLKELMEITEEKEIYELKSSLIEYIDTLIRNNNDTVVLADYDEFSLLFIKTKREPIWKGLIEKMFEETSNIGYSISVFNQSSSYIIFTIIDEKIYAMTGGRGANYISRFIEKNYGLYLIPKIVDRNNQIIKRVSENNITGNNLSTERVTKNATSVSMEDGLGNIYRELSIQISKNIAKKLGVDGIDDDKQISVTNGDSIIIRKSISLEELKIILSKLSKLEESEDKFILNYFVPIRKKGISQAYVRNLMINELLQDNCNSFQLLSDNISEYYFSSSKYILTLDDQELINSDTPISLQEVLFSTTHGTKELTKTKIEKILMNCELETKGENGEIIINKQRVFDLIQGIIEDEEHCFFLINGSWYIFEKHFFDTIDRNYKYLFDANVEESNIVLKKFDLQRIAKSEDSYNDMFKDNKKIIKVHKHEIKYIELADLIFYDGINVYLMCNKGTFGGAQVRDLENKINTSMQMLSVIRKNDKKLLMEYYQGLEKNEKGKIPEEDFMNLFKKQITFVAGFLKGYKRETKSPYAKYLLCELDKKLRKNGYNFLIMNYSLDDKKIQL